MDWRSISVRQSVNIDAPPERVWEAITGDVTGWWGAGYLLEDDSTKLVLPAELGGLVAESNGERQNLWGVVSAVSPHEYIEFTGAIGMGLGAHGQVRYSMTRTFDGGTTLTVAHEAIGPIGESAQTSYDHGWADLNTRLKTLVETGEAYGLAGHNAPVPTPPS